jgi:hypothetical protein
MTEASSFSISSSTVSANSGVRLGGFGGFPEPFFLLRLQFAKTSSAYDLNSFEMIYKSTTTCGNLS